MKCAQIYHALENEAFNKMFVNVRGRFGAESITMNETLRRIIQLKREGTKTIIPSKASAKISMRLVPNQDWKKIAVLFEDYFRQIAPPTVKVKVEALHGGQPYVSPTDLPAYKAAEKAVETTFGIKPLPFYSGGSIPIISAQSTTKDVCTLATVVL